MSNKRKVWKDKVNEAVKVISQYQSGLKKPFDTGIDHYNKNCLGGIYPGDVIVIGGLPSHGKTYLMQQIENNVIELNKGSKIACLRHYYEMSVQKLVLRNLKSGTKLKMTEILLQKPDESRKSKFNSILQKERETDAQVIDEALTAQEFEEETEAFLQENADKDLCLVSLDHILLVKKTKGEKKDAVDMTMEAVLRLKMKYTNAAFIILSQLNREIESRTNTAEMAPRMSDLYQSSVMAFGADIILMVHTPWKLGHKKYLALDREKYAYLEDFFAESSSEKWVNLDTFNTIFTHYVKLRTPDDYEFDDIFATRIGKKRMTDEEYESTSKKIIKRGPETKIDDF